MQELFCRKYVAGLFGCSKLILMLSCRSKTIRSKKSVSIHMSMPKDAQIQGVPTHVMQQCWLPGIEAHKIQCEICEGALQHVCNASMHSGNPADSCASDSTEPKAQHTIANSSELDR